jgi:hypothetical protein
VPQLSTTQAPSDVWRQPAPHPSPATPKFEMPTANSKLRTTFRMFFLRRSGPKMGPGPAVERPAERRIAERDIGLRLRIRNLCLASAPAREDAVPWCWDCWNRSGLTASASIPEIPACPQSWPRHRIVTPKHNRPDEGAAARHQSRHRRRECEGRQVGEIDLSRMLIVSADVLVRELSSPDCGRSRLRERIITTRVCRSRGCDTTDSIKRRPAYSVACRCVTDYGAPAAEHD